MGKTKQVKFTVWGEPKGKGRPRFTKTGNYVKTYTPKDTAIYENLVRLSYENQCAGEKFEDEMLDLRILAYYTIPKSASQKKQEKMRNREIRPTKKPDMDNIVKVIADSLNKIAYKDDAQIVDTMVRKFYSDNPRVEILIKNLEVNKNG